MPLFIASLNSGSNGNCYYAGNDSEAVIVDVGISCREFEQRMLKLNLPVDRVKAIFISHEHIDHIRGVDVLSKKYKIPVFISPLTLKNSRMRLQPELERSFQSEEMISIGNLDIIPFEKHHDAKDPFSFVIEESGVKVGVITDIGIACERVVHYFKQCHACFLESNYDDQMLEDGGYPLRLKNRIKGGKGHLSNKQALELFLNHRPPFMSHLILSHLSNNNNNPDVVRELFLKHAEHTNIIIASRHNESDVFLLNALQEERVHKLKPFISKESRQLKLQLNFEY